MQEKTRQNFLSKLGPGLVTGAADDDPSGIATYSQAGAQFGFNTLWSILLTFPLMLGIQTISARIGAVTGHGLATNISRQFPKSLLYFILIFLLAANIINIGADLIAMGDVLTLVIGGSRDLYVITFCIISIGLQVFVPYKRYVNVLKWLTLSLFSYIGTIFAINIPWSKVFLHTFIPHISWNKTYITTIVAILGTTISPYLFFWQASQEVEDQRCSAEKEPLKKDPKNADIEFSRIKIDNYIGMGVSNLVAFFIILTTAVTLNAHGVTSIETIAQAASALKPVVGEFAFLLFSMGIIGSGMLAIPVLAGSSAYAIAGTFNWNNSLEYAPKKAKRFYSVIAAVTLCGAAMIFTMVKPIDALYWSAVINGMVALPVMVLMMLIANNQKIMKKFTLSRKLFFLGWIATLFMMVAVAVMVVTMFI